MLFEASWARFEASVILGDCIPNSCVLYVLSHGKNKTDVSTPEVFSKQHKPYLRKLHSHAMTSE